MMKTLIKLVIVSFGLSLCLTVFSANTVSKVTYKWTDKQGIIQYTERPPKDRAYEKITVSASGGEDAISVSIEDAQTDSKKQTDNLLDEVDRANERNCLIAKQNLEVLTKLSRIRVSDEKGERRILSPEEKQVRLDDTQKQVDIYCNSRAKK